MKVLSKLSLLPMALIGISQANAFDFNGYIRSGVGFSEKGDNQWSYFIYSFNNFYLDY